MRIFLLRCPLRQSLIYVSGVAELVLSVLVQNFAFERGDKPIVWNYSGIVYPSLSPESTKPELWLTVRKLQV